MPTALIIGASRGLGRGLAVEHARRGWDVIATVRREAYRISKAGLSMGLRLLCLRHDDARTYLALNPGWVRTDMGTQYATLSVEDSVEHLADLLAAHRGRGGTAFLDYDGSPLPW